MSDSQTNTTPQFDDLDWAAFQYISGELSAEECRDFEERLAVDQAARDAVVHAVQLSQVTAVALNGSNGEPVELASAQFANGSFKIDRRMVALAAAACAALALIFLPSWLSLDNDRSNNSHASSSDATEMHDLALAWATARDELVVEPRRVYDDPITGPVSTLSAESTELSDEIETPSWMLIAVAGVMKDSDGNAPLVE